MTGEPRVTGWKFLIYETILVVTKVGQESANQFEPGTRDGAKRGHLPITF